LYLVGPYRLVPPTRCGLSIANSIRQVSTSDSSALEIAVQLKDVIPSRKACLKEALMDSNYGNSRVFAQAQTFLSSDLRSDMPLPSTVPARSNRPNFNWLCSIRDEVSKTPLLQEDRRPGAAVFDSPYTFRAFAPQLMQAPIYAH
jgi:hypothetical protein